MGRVIKFRAWDTYCKRWRCELDWVIDPSDGLPHWVHEDEVQGVASQLIVSEFTGLTDKSNNPVFEGDILAIDGEVIAPVTFEDGSFQLIALREQGRSPLIQDRAKRMEIIGNVFEDSNLIDKEK